jgi:E3 ubiquitin-protein ligase HECTD3
MAQVIGYDVTEALPILLGNVTDVRTENQLPGERIKLNVEALTWTDSYGHENEPFRILDDSNFDGKGELHSIAIRIDSNDQSLVGVAFENVQTDTHLGGVRGGWGYFSEGKMIVESEFRTPNNATVTEAKYKRGDTVTCTYDATTRTVCFFKNDVLVHTENALPESEAAVRFAVGGTPGSCLTIISDSLLPAASTSIRLDSAAAGRHLMAFPLLQSVDPQILTRRAALLRRYSALVMSVLSLVQLDGACGSTGTAPICGEIGRLRSILLAEHKSPAIARTLDSIRRKGSQVRMPEFKISRARARLGEALAADGSDSIAFQVYHELKQQNAATRAELYCGRELWWKIEFVGEGVQDCGGGFRESVSDIASDLMSARTPLFIPSPNQEAWVGDLRDSFVPNPACTSSSPMYEWIGRLFAAAILSDESLPIKMPPLIWKLLGNSPVSQADLRQVDEWFYQLLQQMDQCLCYVDGTQVPIAADEFSFTFSQSFQVPLSNGSMSPLVENGGSREVDYDSRHEFVALATATRLGEFDAQVAAMRRGLCDIIPPPLLQLWTAAELEQRVCGAPSVSVLAIRDAARYDLDRNAPEVALLWEALELMTDEERSKFLRFVTGRSRLPASIKIARGGDPISLPQSATCFSILRLPAYTTVKETLEKLRYAVHNCMAIDTDGVRATESFA